MLLAKSTPSEEAGNGQKERADGGSKDRPRQSLPVAELPRLQAARLICRNMKQNFAAEK